MAENKRFYWLKLHEDFFSSKRIKKLRKIAGGDTYTIIYLKMQLLSLQTKGMLEYTGLESDFAEEIALDIDEDVENVKITIQYMIACGLMEEVSEDMYSLPFVKQSIGSETASTQRSRKCRENKALGIGVNDESVALQHDCNDIKDIDIDKDIDINNNSAKHYANDLFEQLWKLYPNKKGKGQVSNKAKKNILAIGYDEFKRCIERYVADLEKDSSWRKAQNGSTFFNSGYVDYLDANYESSAQEVSTVAVDDGWE